MRRTFPAVLLAGSLSGAAAADPAVLGPEAVDRVAADALARWHAPGLALAVVRDGQTVVLKGYGSKRVGLDDPVTPDTLFPLASCSKTFTTALIAALVDDGVLGWDEPVRKHLPTFHLSDPNADALVSLRDLCSHRTGVLGHDLLWYRATWDLDETLRRAGRLPLTAPFRGAWQYNSIQFTAAGRSAERAAGRPWADLVRERFGQPLGMTGLTFSAADEERAADRAGGHKLAPDGAAAEPMPGYSHREPNPAGSVAATARDLDHWLKFQLTGRAADGRRLLSADGLAELRTPQIVMRKTPSVRDTYPDSKQVSYGLGWVVCDHRGELVAAHGGLIDGFRVQLTLLPERGVGFAVLANLHDTRVTTAVSNRLIDLACGLPDRDWDAYYLKLDAADRSARRVAALALDQARVPGVAPTLAAGGYAGEYEDPVYGVGRVRADGGRLSWEWSGFRCPLGHYQGDVYRVAGGFFDGQLVQFGVVAGKATAVRVMGREFGRK